MPWRREEAAGTDTDASRLAPIRIVTPELELAGFVAPAGQRITDMLLRGQDLAFLPAGAAEDPENWIRVSPNDILFVVPPPLRIRSAWKEGRDLREVTLETGDYRLTGTAHLAPGSDALRELGSTGLFLPLTGARVSRGSSGEDERLDVVIVNLALSTRWD